MSGERARASSMVRLQVSLPCFCETDFDKRATKDYDGGVRGGAPMRPEKLPTAIPGTSAVAEKSAFGAQPPFFSPFIPRGRHRAAASDFSEGLGRIIGRRSP